MNALRRSGHHTVYDLPLSPRDVMNRSAATHLQAFFKDPKGVSALLPTSAPVAGRIVSKVGPKKANLIVEYGPGSGVLTHRLLERLSPDGRLVAIEANPDLAARLADTLEDERVIVVRDSAQGVCEILERLDLASADCVLSGIPFSWFPPATGFEIVANTHKVLKPGGRFVTYQVFFQRRRHLRTHLERCFSTVRSEIGLHNLPPYRICEAVK